MSFTSTSNSINDFRQGIYLHKLSEPFEFPVRYSYVNRKAALLIATIDITASFVEDIVKVVEGIFRTIGSFVNFVTQSTRKGTFQNTISHAEDTVIKAISLPVKLATAPIKLVLQTIYIIKNAEEARAWGHPLSNR